MRATLFSFAFSLIVAGCARDEAAGGSGGGTLTSIEVTPANAVIAVENGSSNPVVYTAIGHFADGHTEALADATFGLDASGHQLGSITGSQFAASGQAAGTGQVTATVGMVTGSTPVTVTVRRVNVGPDVPADAPAHFDTAASGGALAPTVLYPLEGAVMPVTAKAPNVQWEGPAQDGDLFRVRLTGGGATVDGIVAAGPGFTFSWQPSSTDFDLIMKSALGQPIQITVAHYDPQNGAQEGSAVSIRAVLADVGGAVYYWDLGAGSIQRISDTGRAPAIPTPPASPGDPNNRCVACHEVSRDGRYLAAELWGGGDVGAVFDLSNPAVASADPAPTVAPTGGYRALFSTFNPDATRLIVNEGQSLKLVDPKAGMTLAPGGAGLPGAKASHPTWSPDGTLVAFINNINGSWGVDYTSGDLHVIPVTGPDAFDAPQPLVTSSTGDPAFRAPSWPSFTPDSQWIAFAAGVNSRGRNNKVPDGNGGTKEETYPGALFLVSRSGGQPVQLDTACGGARNCYLPSFSPYDSGGYFWLVFYSFRDYGNAQAGTKGTGRRQLWITAIDKAKLGTGDPSMVPYWLPDQDSKTENMSAFWAVPPPLL